MSKQAPRMWLRYVPRFLLVLPILAMMWVPSYNTIEPRLAGIPFFYWYQIAWILIGAALVLIIYCLETGITRGAR
jgi:Protein of unknown function (DUF3311)